VQRGQERIREAAKLGYRTVLIPSANKPKQSIENVKIITVKRVEDALEAIRD
jgi:DNA repair protein RadA/Sms